MSADLRIRAKSGSFQPSYIAQLVAAAGRPAAKAERTTSAVALGSSRRIHTVTARVKSSPAVGWWSHRSFLGPSRSFTSMCRNLAKPCASCRFVGARPNRSTGTVPRRRIEGSE
jgi:hypothetical protein